MFIYCGNIHFIVRGKVRVFVRCKELRNLQRMVRKR